MTRFDYIVVGAGTAGCVLAARLSEAAQVNVLLLEAGPDMAPGAEAPSVTDPYPMSVWEPSFFWPGLQAESGVAQPSTPAAVRPLEQARIMGGGSSIHGMVALRGVAADYAEWHAAGAHGWDWDGVLPYFRKLERDLDYAGPDHGTRGPIPIRRVPRDEWAPLARAAAQVWREWGHADIDDLNADGRTGIASVPMSNLPDRRVSSAMGYLDTAVRARPNLRILTGACVHGLRREGRRFSGVDVVVDGSIMSFGARETILCAGAIHTPALLLRAGVGPARELAVLGIEPVADRIGVGANLQNHPIIYMHAHLKADAVQPAAQRAWSQNCLRYSSGQAGCAPADMAMFVVNKGSWHALGRRMGAVSTAIYKSYSRGRVALKPGTPHGVQVGFNTLSDERDLRRMVAGVQHCARVHAHPAVRRLRNESLLASARVVRLLNRPGTATGLLSAVLNAALSGPAFVRRRALAAMVLDVDRLATDEAAAHAFVLQRTGLMGHPVGTCRLGSRADDEAVVDPHCRVIGVEGLRVADGSIMPTIVTGNTNIPITMIGEKAADLILRDAA